MTAAKLPKEQFPFAACPFMSEVYIQPTSKLTMPAGSGPLPLGGSLGPSVQMIPIPCMGPDCQLWDSQLLRCDLGPARELWMHDIDKPVGALTGKSGADNSTAVIGTLRALQSTLEAILKKLK